MSTDPNAIGDCPVCGQGYRAEDDVTDNKTIPMDGANHICFLNGKVYIHMVNEND